MKISIRQEEVVRFKEQEKLSLLHISDIHLKYSTCILTELDRLIKNHNPDIILMTGDYYDIPKGAYNFREFLLNISRDYLVLFIRGNHDILYGSKVLNLLSGIPNCICVDDSVFRYKSRQGHYLNITSWQNRGELSEGKDITNVLLIHNPEKIKEGELINIHLILAGHLHGGQFILFKTKKNSFFPGNILYKYCMDRRQIKGTTVIVSKGLGDTFPLRFNCPKEIVKVIIT